MEKIRQKNNGAKDFPRFNCVVSILLATPLARNLNNNILNSEN